MARTVSGKSNLIEAISLLRSAATDMADTIRRGGGIQEWIWKGKSDAAASIEVVVSNANGGIPLRHHLAFITQGQTFQIFNEEISDAFAEQGIPHSILGATIMVQETILKEYEDGPVNAWDRFDRRDKLNLIDTGLPPTGQRPKSVIVVGAGMAGLTAAYELKRAGHRVTVLEAQQRTGGRIWTLRAPFSDGLFGEAGAMRLPTTHKLIRSYINKAGLEANLAKFNMSDDNGIYYFHNKRVRVAEYDTAPERLGFDTPPLLEDRGRLYRPGVRDAQNEMVLPFQEDPQQLVAGPLWRHRTAQARWQDVMRGIRDAFCDAAGEPDWEELSTGCNARHPGRILRRGR